MNKKWNFKNKGKTQSLYVNKNFKHEKINYKLKLTFKLIVLTFQHPTVHNNVS